MVLGYGLWSLAYGREAPANPWAAATLEWTNVAAIPDPHNFVRTPLVTRGPYDFHLADEVFGGGDGAGDGAAAGAVTLKAPEAAPDAPESQEPQEA
jgi:cytochrome c oxidase subunit 1